jgi:hypothetical protein
MDISNNRPVPGKNFVARMQVEGDGRFNASSRESCQRCSEREGLSFAFAHGKRIWLCDRHYREWFKTAHEDREMVRQSPYKPVTGITGADGVEQDVKNQDRRLW